MNRVPIAAACWVIVVLLAVAAGVGLAIAAEAESALVSAFAAAPPLATPSWVDQVTRATTTRSAAGSATVVCAVAALVAAATLLGGTALIRMPGSGPRRASTAAVVAVVGVGLLVASLASADPLASPSAQSIALDPSTQTALVDQHTVAGAERDGTPVLVTLATDVDGRAVVVIAPRVDIGPALGPAGSVMTVDVASGAIANSNANSPFATDPTVAVSASSARRITQGEDAATEFGALTTSTVFGWAGVLLLALAAALVSVRMRRGPVALLVAAVLAGIAAAVCVARSEDPLRGLLARSSSSSATLVPDPSFAEAATTLALAAVVFAVAAVAVGAVRAAVEHEPAEHEPALRATAERDPR